MNEEDNLFRDLCENASDLIQSVAPDGRLLYVNKSWLATLGYAPGDLSSITVLDVIHPDSREHCMQMFQRVMAGESVENVETVFISKQGRRILVEGASSCRFENGKPVSTRGIFRDVTKRKQAEEERDRFFNLSLDLLCIAGFDGYFKQLNPAFERALGYSRQELLSRAFIEFVHPEDRAVTLAEIEKLSKGVPTVDFENRYLAKDGSYRWLAWRAAPWPDEGRIYAVARDTTEQKHAQEVMTRQAQELARSNADLEQFAYAASHDLKAPLASIAGLSAWIEEDAPGSLPEPVREHLALIRSRVARMERLVDDLLRYARAGRIEETVGPVDTGALVRDVVFLLAVPEKFVVTIRPGMPVIETARAPLEQVFTNLIGNAIKHHDRPEGTILVSARESAGWVEFSVADDGPGIAEGFKDRLFEMFQTLKSRDQVEGSGIGLALVKRIVEGRGGKVALESGPGRGAIFHFTWPKGTERHANDSGGR